MERHRSRRRCTSRSCDAYGIHPGRHPRGRLTFQCAHPGVGLQSELLPEHSCERAECRGLRSAGLRLWSDERSVQSSHRDLLGAHICIRSVGGNGIAHSAAAALSQPRGPSSKSDAGSRNGMRRHEGEGFRRRAASSKKQSTVSQQNQGNHRHPSAARHDVTQVLPLGALALQPFAIEGDARAPLPARRR